MGCVWLMEIVFAPENFNFFFPRYLKAKRNRSGEIRLAPWNISNQVSSNQDDNYKTNVPINATLIGSFGTAVYMVLGILIVNNLDNEGSNAGLYSILVIITTIHLPLVLAFTIKYNKKNNKVTPIIPQTLQFHEDMVESLEENNESQSSHNQSPDNKDEAQNMRDQTPKLQKTLQFHKDKEETLPGTLQFLEDR